ncbi:MAG TPA: SPOR domain-containing protein [Edaphobacter sp.]
MQLWTDYEGRTIAESYPLEKLLRPEGRSAFFSTSNGTGTPAVIRLIEAHFDESEILNRWRVVAEINQINLVHLKKYGQTTLDETPLVYAVMETTEGSLAEVLSERALTPEETRQVATSLVAALEALHARNLVHEHIEPANVLAVGEVVKLRSDCIREVPTTSDDLHLDGKILKTRDVHDLAFVLLQCLTQQSTLPSGSSLPAPFDAIIRNGTTGVWGLPQIAAALNPTSRPIPAKQPAPAPATASGAPGIASDVWAGSPPVSSGATQSPKYDTPRPRFVEPVDAAPSKPIQQPAPPTQAADVRHRIVRPVEPAPLQRKGLWIAAAIGAILLALILWHFLSPNPTTQSSTEQPITTLAATQPADPAAAPTTPSSRPTLGTKVNSQDVSSATPRLAEPTTNAHNQWRVVAYTYNHEDQARKKVATIAKRHPTLNPEVFTPNGHAPYLVTVGGPMTREEANAFKQKARADGLPHDIYTQNYTR